MNTPPGHGQEPGSAAEQWELLLFVVPGDGSDRRVHETLQRICAAHLPDRHRIIVIDIAAEPAQADAYDIVAVPTVVRAQPLPVRRVIGDLSATDRVLKGLGIPSRDAA